MGFRYLKSKKSSRFLSFITVLSMMGVGIGVTAMIVVLSVMDGFEAELKKRLMSSELHILLQPKKGVPFFDMGFVPKDSLDDSGASELLADQEKFKEVWPIVATEAILRTGRKVTGVVAKGVTSGRLEKLKEKMIETAESPFLSDNRDKTSIRLPGLIVGKELAYDMDLIPGDRVTLISPTETSGPLESVPKLKRFVVEGIYESGIPEEELHVVFTRAGAVRSFVRKRNVVSQWEISVQNFKDAPQLGAELKKLLPEFLIKDWIQLNSSLFASLRLERIAMFVILAFIVVVASFNIVTTLTLMVLEKRKEIAILKTMGAEKAQVAAVFLAEGLIIGLVGVGGGILAGFLISLGLRSWEFIQLPDIYYDRTLPVTFEPLYYSGVGLIAVLIVLAACIYPSRRAARLHPIHGIRQG